MKYGSFQTGSAGIQYRHQLYDWSLQASRGYKAPSLYQLYAPDISGDPVGNSSLKPEKNNSIETRLNFGNSSFGPEISLFQNRLYDLITFTSGQGYLNQSTFTIQGLELTAKGSIKDTFMRVSYTVQDFTHHEETVLRRPKQSWLTSLVYSFSEQWELESKWRWYSHRFDLDPDGRTVKLNSYEVLDLGLNIYKKVSLGFQLSNVFSREYEDLYGYSVIPRAYFFNLSFEI